MVCSMSQRLFAVEGIKFVLPERLISNLTFPTFPIAHHFCSRRMSTVYLVYLDKEATKLQGILIINRN